MTAPPAFDQFTRWLCPKCGSAGFDSWNKALFDGVVQVPGALPNPWILGDMCQNCTWPAVTRYTTPDQPPRAIFGPDADSFSYEDEAMRMIAADPGAAEQLAPSTSRDTDWSRGCLEAKSQLQ